MDARAALFKLRCVLARRSTVFRYWGTLTAEMARPVVWLAAYTLAGQKHERATIARFQYTQIVQTRRHFSQTETGDFATADMASERAVEVVRHCGG